MINNTIKQQQYQRNDDDDDDDDADDADWQHRQRVYIERPV